MRPLNNETQEGNNTNTNNVYVYGSYEVPGSFKPCICITHVFFEGRHCYSLTGQQSWCLNNQALFWVFYK